ncbi:putative epoxide hydrolase [Gordonia effusa NBRC 100432]|uniref:Putative epoxide hydrolase n=1 Tax=Gordonia effusa NBRC 100432 TaxID=1077974 RepID=H0QVJ9_9ACTN|nr:alpha/beta fold hydrolase [Gordonia effusa]GAB16805.1 putative epoxide hydrolase [Gordonia effusa NBRC 100432]
MADGRINEFRRGELRFPVVDSGPLDGPVAVLLHGFPQTATSWSKVAEILNGNGIRTIAPNQRGYASGAAPKRRWAYRNSELVADIRELIDQIGGPVHIVGHDWGANVAWSIAGLHPDQVRTLTAVSVPHSAAFIRAVLTSDQARRSWYMLAFQPPKIPELSIRLRPAFFDAMLTKTGMTAEMVAQVHTDIIDTVGLTGPLNWYRGLPFANRRGIKRVKVPTTYVWSDGDTALGSTGAHLTEQYVDGPYRFETLSGASHWIPDERPAELAQIITETIGSG